MAIIFTALVVSAVANVVLTLSNAALRHRCRKVASEAQKLREQQLAAQLHDLYAHPPKRTS